MRLISHRGNINGKQPIIENMPSYVDTALKLGYDVEVDVWYESDIFYLGHDFAQYEIKEEYLNNKRLWCHAKNSAALYFMRKANIHCFWHEGDDYTLTSQGYTWTYPKKELHENSICVLPELGYNGVLEKCFGICSDYVEDYK